MYYLYKRVAYVANALLLTLFAYSSLAVTHGAIPPTRQKVTAVTEKLPRPVAGKPIRPFSNDPIRFTLQADAHSLILKK